MGESPMGEDDLGDYYQTPVPSDSDLVSHGTTVLLVFPRRQGLFLLGRSCPAQAESSMTLRGRLRHGAHSD